MPHIQLNLINIDEHSKALEQLEQEAPLSPHSKGVMQKIASDVRQITDLGSKLKDDKNPPSIANIEAVFRHVTECNQRIETALTNIKRKYEVEREKDPTYFLGFKNPLGSPNSNDLYNRTSQLQAHKETLSGILAFANTQKALYDTAKSKVAKHQLVLDETTEERVSVMSARDLKENSDFKTHNFRVAGSLKRSPKEVFEELSHTFRLDLNEDDITKRVATFGTTVGPEPEAIRGLDIQALKFCTSLSYQYLYSQFLAHCNDLIGRDEKPYLLPVSNTDSKRELDISKDKDNHAVVQMKVPMQLTRQIGEAPVASLTAELIAKIGQDGKVRVQCKFYHVLPTQNATLHDLERLQKVIPEEEQVIASNAV